MMESALETLKESLENPTKYLSGALGSGAVVDKKKLVRSSYEHLTKLCKLKKRNSEDVKKAIDELTKALAALTKKDFTIKSEKYRSAITRILEAVDTEKPGSGSTLDTGIRGQTVASAKTNKRTDSPKQPGSSKPGQSAPTVTAGMPVELQRGILSWMDLITSNVKNEDRRRPQPKPLEGCIKGKELLPFCETFENLAIKITTEIGELHSQLLAQNLVQDELNASLEEYKNKLQNKQSNKEMKPRRSIDGSNSTQTEEVHRLEGELKKQREELDKVRVDKQLLMSRISKIAGAKMTDGNPAIADLSDPNRPSRLAERFGELYDNMWTESLDILTQGVDGPEREARDVQVVKDLLEILKSAYTECEREAKEQMVRMKEVLFLGTTEENVSVEVSKQLKEARKVSTVYSIKDIVKKIKGRLKSPSTEIDFYTQECTELCWLMVIQDPPVCFYYGRDSPGSSIDTDRFTFFTKSGTIVDYLVWPALLLHTDGPLLRKGVVQPE